MCLVFFVNCFTLSRLFVQIYQHANPWGTCLLHAPPHQRQPLVGDDLWWKTTFGGKWSTVEDNLWWNPTFSGRLPAVEEKLQWKITLGGRRPLVEDNLEDYQMKMNISGRRPSLDPCMLPTPLRGIFRQRACLHMWLCGWVRVCVCLWTTNF